METKKMLKVREKNKKNKPTFVVKESKFSARVKSRWRFPRGKHSKVRQMHKGRPKLANVGFGSPKAVKDLHKTGLEMIKVSNVQDLNLLNPDTQGAIVSKIGKKKMLEILKAAAEKKVQIFNVKDVAQKITLLEKEFQLKKKQKETKLKQKSAKEADKLKKAEEKKKKEESEKPTKEEPEKSESKEADSDKVKEEKRTIEKTIIKKQ